MLDLLENLPLPFTTLIVMAISVAATVGISKLISGRIRWLLAVAVPIAISYTLYWSPVWFAHRTDVAEYSAWAPILMTAWSMPSVLACLVCVAIVRKRHRMHEHV